MIQIILNWFLNGGWLVVLTSLIGIGCVILFWTGIKSAKEMPLGFQTGFSKEEMIYRKELESKRGLCELDEFDVRGIEPKKRVRFEDWNDQDETDLSFFNKCQ